MEKAFEILNEYEITRTDQQQIGQLLVACFPSYPADKIAIKQLPSFRIIFRKDSLIKGHIAVTYRWMQLGEKIIKVFGLSDICVEESVRAQKIATQMINRLAEIGKDQEVDFLVLIAAETDVYKNMGFKEVENRCRWLLIHKDRSLGIAQRNIEEGLMIKPLGKEKWREGILDFLGPVF